MRHPACFPRTLPARNHQAMHFYPEPRGVSSSAMGDAANKPAAETLTIEARGGSAFRHAATPRRVIVHALGDDRAARSTKQKQHETFMSSTHKPAAYS